LINFLLKIIFFIGALEDLTLSEQNFEYFDAIVMSEVVEHVNNVDIFISNAAKLLKVCYSNDFLKFFYQ
jgi:2-polyprenyl-3-methyl-5-hydroxy-6-metoxy-1,4-benzoquinol methylase